MNRNALMAEASESAENPNPQNNVYARNRLLHDAIARFGSESDQNTVRLFSHYLENMADSTLESELKAGVLSMRNEYKTKNSLEANISPDEIDKAFTDKGLIRRIVLDETSERRSLELSVWKTLQSRYSSGVLLRYQTQIKAAFSHESSYNLKQILKKEKSGENFLRKCRIPIPPKKQLDELIVELDLDKSMIDADPQLQWATDNYLKTGQMGSSDMEALILAHTHLTSDQKSKIVTFFLPTISVKQLESFGLIGADQREKWILGLLNDILRDAGKIGPNQTVSDIVHDRITKQELDNWLRGTNDVFIPTDRLDHAMIARFFAPGASAILADALADFSENVTQSTERHVQSLADFIGQVKRGTENFPEHKKIKNISSFRAGKAILSHRNDGQKAWKIIDTDVVPENNTPPRRGLMIEGFDSKGYSAGVQFIEYDVLLSAILEELKSLSESVEIVDNVPDFFGKIDMTEDQVIEDADNLISYLDRIDSQGKSHGFKEGIAFTVVVKHKKEIYRIKSVNRSNNSFTLEDQYGGVPKGVEGDIRFHQLYALLQQSNNIQDFKRIGNFSTLENFAQNCGITQVSYDHGKLVIHHGHHNEEDHNDHAKNDAEVWGFQNGNGAYIRTEFDGNQVIIYEYQKYIESKKTKEGKRDKKDKIKVIKYPKMNLEGLHIFLQEHKFTEAISEDPQTKKDEEVHDEVHPHFHKRGIFGMLMGMRSFHDLSKAFEMGTHMIQHMFEEQSQMHAAESMYNLFSKTLGKENTLTMHALMEFSSKIGKAIDEKVSHIKGLGGLPRRKEIKHILLTKPPKPHEILAALIVTAEMAGHLYPDTELQELQGGRYLWFESVCEALGFDTKTELARCKKKVSETNNETKDHPHEAQLIERLFKFHQDDSPYIQAIAGGGKFWNAITTGRNGQKEKGEKEGGQFLGAMDRAEYTFSKLVSNEPEIAVGAFPTIYGKDPSAVNLGPAFVWALSNFPNTAHPDVSNQFKNMMDGNGVAFHALPFCRNSQMASVYQETMNIVVHHSGDPEMQAAWKKVQSFRPHGKYVFKEEHIQELWAFWKAYNAKIHPILQLTSPKLALLYEDPHLSAIERSTIKGYFDTMKAVVDTGRLSDKAPDEMIMKQGGYRFDGGSMVPDIDGNLKSISRILKYVGIGTYNGEMDSNHYKHLWKDSIMPFLESIREDPLYISHPDFQKRQFSKTHDEIIDFLRAKMTAGKYVEALKTQPYLRDLQMMGFDMSAANVYQEIPLGKSSDYGINTAFQNFTNGHHNVSSVGQHVSQKVAVELGKHTPLSSSNNRSSDTHTINDE